MNPLLLNLIREYLQLKKIDAGEYEITDLSGKVFRVRQEEKEATGTKDWRIDINDPENSPYPDDPWVYTDHVRTLQDAKEVLFADSLKAESANNPALIKEMMGRSEEISKEIKNKKMRHSRWGRGGGGALPQNILESKTAPRGLLGPKKRRY